MWMKCGIPLTHLASPGPGRLIWLGAVRKLVGWDDSSHPTMDNGSPQHGLAEVCRAIRYSVGDVMREKKPSDLPHLEEGPPPSATSSDRSLLRRFQNGQVDAATQLYLRYAKRLRALASAQLGRDLAARVDPEDLVQSVFRSFFRRAKEDHYDVPEGEELWKLLLVIALHKIRDAASYHRAAKRDVRTTRGGAAFDEAMMHAAGTDEASLIELSLLIKEVLGQLTASQRTIVELRIEGRQVAEIAQETKRSRRTVERALQDFRGRLKALLTEDV